MLKNRKLKLILTILILLIVLTSCAVPRDEAGNIKYISDNISFNEFRAQEGFFQTLLVFPLTKILNFIIANTGSVFIGVAVLTFLVHAIVLLVTWKSNVATLKMQQLQPELKKIQEKYADRTDQQARLAMGAEMQALYQKNKVNPFASMLTMFLQLPIIFSIYYAVNRSERVMTGSFLGVNLAKTPMEGIVAFELPYILIFVVMMLLQVASMYIPTYLSERRAKIKAAKEHRRYVKQPNPMKMMMPMMIIVLFFSVSWPSAMSIYWSISSVVQIVKSLVIDYFIHRRG